MKTTAPYIYPFVFKQPSGPTLLLTATLEWKIVREIGGKEDPCDDRGAGEFLREFGRRMMEADKK